VIGLLAFEFPVHFLLLPFMAWTWLRTGMHQPVLTSAGAEIKVFEGAM
jgi:hypothetical protein